MLSCFVLYCPSILSKILLWSVYLFFFFKQKTAYEMRISDWSSDVCSSDLVSLADLRADGKWPDYVGYCDAFYFAVPPGFPHDPVPEEQIGRASCRERVC